MPMTYEQRRIIESTIRGLKATDAEEVIVDVGQILKVIPLARVEQENLFYYIVETEEVIITKQKPNSVIPAEHLVKKAGMGHVKREQLLELLEEYQILLSNPSSQEKRVQYVPLGGPWPSDYVPTAVQQPIEKPIEEIPHLPAQSTERIPSPIVNAEDL